MINYAILSEFDQHKLVMDLHSDNPTKLRGFIAIHRGHPGLPAFGATRFWKYPNEEEALRDALRLSKLMSYKAAMARLNYGGAKGVIIDEGVDTDTKARLVREYAEKVNELNGAFVTGADMGINEHDVEEMSEMSKFICGISSRPAYFTAIGLVYSIRLCLEERFGNPGLEERSIAIQGLGKVGVDLLKLIYEEAKEIFVADINPHKIKMIQNHFPEARIVDPEEIHKQEVDVYSPCAHGGILNERTVPELKCKIIAGGANNQLETEDAGIKLFDTGIVYAPDYVVNAGGLISVVDEYEHKSFNEDRIKGRLYNIRRTLREILINSKTHNRATNLIANEMAEKIFNHET